MVVFFEYDARVEEEEFGWGGRWGDGVWFGFVVIFTMLVNVFESRGK